MKYADLIEIKEGYHPVYDIENESPDSWKRFIPTSNFYKVLTTVLNSIEPSSGQEKKRSIWIRGTYGTGKSHVTSVIKHLLWDDLGNIKEYVNDFESQYEHRINSFRKNNRVFPVILKGASNITDNRSFAAVVQKAVTDSLEKEGFSISIDTDFKKYCGYIEKTKSTTNWDKHIGSNTELKMHVTDCKDLLSKLKGGNAKILRYFEKSLSEQNTFVVVDNLRDWLKKVVEELRKEGIADYLMIFWDEFTSILESSESGVSSSEWQNLAELSKDNNVYLFIVIHRFPQTYSIDDERKTLDRFNHVEYLMETLTTYHIMEGAIKKKNREKWEELKNKHVLPNSDLIDLITDLVHSDYKISDTVVDLFPIHPYSSYLTTFISRNLGSSQRSVFNFLTDGESGFLNFIKDNPNGKSGIFLTADVLWDFFLNEFEGQDVNMMSPIIDKFKSNIKKIEKKGDSHAAVFKVITLLNVLNTVTRVQDDGGSYVEPTESNITKMFIGTEHADSLAPALEYIHESGIVQRNPFGVYEIVASSLDTKKVKDVAEKLKKNFILLDNFTKYNRDKLKKAFVYGTLRKTHVELFDADETEHSALTKLHGKKVGECKSATSVNIFIGRTQAHIKKAENYLKKISADQSFKNSIFVLPQTPMEDTEFESFITYKARENISATLDDHEQTKTNEEQAEKVMTNWIIKIGQGYGVRFFRGKSKNFLVKEFSGQVDKELSLKIFSKGLEKTPAHTATIWNDQRSPKAGEVILQSTKRGGLNQIGGAFKNIQDIFKDQKLDWIIGPDMKIKEEADKTHPLIHAKKEVDSAIEKADHSNFHLGNVLSSLTEPPFGYYTSIVHLGALAFLLKPYLFKLQKTGTGDIFNIPIMRDTLITLFDYWNDGKDRPDVLQVRLGSSSEHELLEKFIDIFDLSEDLKGVNCTPSEDGGVFRA